MATIFFEKVVSVLPSPLTANTIYYVRTGSGFDIYVSDVTGAAAHRLNPPLTWSYLKDTWSEEPSVVGSTAGGTVLEYTLGGVTRYRLVPTAYSAAQDAFYSTFTGGVLSGLIVARG